MSIVITEPIIEKSASSDINFDSNNGKRIVQDSNGILYCCCSIQFNSYYQIYVYKSEDDGNVWTDLNFPQISNYSQTMPSIAIDNNNKVHITWCGKDSNNSNKQQIKYSNNISESWSDWINISIVTGYEQICPIIAIDSNNKCHITWQGADSTYINTQIKYSNNISGSWSGWTNIQRISGYNQYAPDIAIDHNNKVHICWMGLDSGNSYTQIKYSNNISGSWSSLYNIQTISGYAQCSANIAIDSINKIHVVWSGTDSNNLTQQIKYSNYTGSGNWSTWINIQPIPGYNQFYPDIAIDGNKLHITWHGTDSDNTNFQIKYSNNMKGSWSNWINLVPSTYTGSKQYPSVIMNNTNLYCVYEYNLTNIYMSKILSTAILPDTLIGLVNPSTEYNTGKKIVIDSNDILYCCFYTTVGFYNQICVYKSEDDGNTWINMNFPQILGYDQMYPSIAIDSNDKIHITWQGLDSSNKTNTQIKYSNNVSGVWSTWINIQTISGYDQHTPSIAIDSNNKAHVVWSSRDSINAGNNQIKYSNNINGSWSTWFNISVVTGYDQAYPSIAIDSNNKCHIVWVGYDVDNSVFFQQVKYSNNINGGWSTWININPAQDYELYPNIAIDSNNKAHVVWLGQFYHYHATDPYYCEIKYSNNINGSWLTPIAIQEISTYNNNIQYKAHPSIAIDNNNKIHVVSMTADSTYIQIVYSNNISGSWSNWENKTNNTTSNCIDPSCICKNNKTYCAYSTDNTVETFKIVNTIPVTGITLNKTTSTIIKGNTDILISTILPSNATNQTVTWGSSDINIATINSSGLITAINGGACTITATTEDGNYTATCAINVTVPVTGVTLNKTSNAIIVGQTDTLVSNILPNNASNKNVIWTSSNTNIATVDNNGLVTAINAGNCNITCKTEDGNYIATCNITTIVLVSGITLDKVTDTIVVGNTDQLTATVIPNTATSKNITWTSSNTNIATVNSSGLVTAISNGNCIITATTQDGNYNATCNITSIILTNGVTLNKTTNTIIKGNTDTLIATIYPLTATNKNVTWSSSDISIATVDNNGLVTAMDGGACIITVKTQDGNYSATCNINVIIPVTGVALNKTTDTLIKGNTDTLIATIIPNNASNKNVTWSSSDTSIATVDNNGKVTAISGGLCIITCTTVESNYKATCNITVTVPVMEVTLNKTSNTIIVGQTDTLVSSILPNNASNKNVTWSSSNTNIATVNSSGVITAINAGVCNITCKTEDGNYTAICNITTIVLVSGITLDKVTDTIVVGNKDQLTATVVPVTATSKNIIWSSSDTSIATVDNNGLITAISNGNCIITATTQDGNYIATCNITSIILANGVTLNKTTNTIIKGNTDTLIATIYPLTTTNKNVTWSSSDISIATVNLFGLVTAIDGGTCTITVKTEDGNYTATCNINVIIPVTGVTLNKTNDTIIKGNTDQLIATIIPNNASNKNITWTSSDTNIVTVDNNGKITTINNGNCIITCTTVESNYKATCNITVTVPVTGVTLNKTTDTINIEDLDQLIPTILPNNASNKNITWESSDINIATVNSSGLVTSISPGNCIITCTTIDGNYKATCNITVASSITDLTLNKTIENLIINTTEQLSVTILPSDAIYKDIIWTSSNPTMATVSNNGLVTGIGYGKTLITVSIISFSGKVLKSATCNITVINKTIYPTKVKIDKFADDIYMGTTVNLKAIIYPTYATNKNVIWSSSDTNIATIDNNGLVTGILPGISIITASLESYDKYIRDAVCYIVVRKNIYATSITLDKTTDTIYEGETHQLIATITPNNTTNKDIIWSSSDTNIATVNNGIITAISEGTCTIYAVIDNVYTSCVVTVPDSNTSVTSIVLDKTEVTINIGDHEQLIPTVYPNNTENKGIIWSSSDTNGILISSYGIIFANRAGTYTITATTKDNNKTATCKVTVTTPIEDIVLNKQEIALSRNMKKKLIATIIPKDATNKEINWESSDTSIATVDNTGIVTGILKGQCIITATTIDGNYTAKCNIIII